MLVTSKRTIDAVVRALADEYSRKIMMSAISRPKSVEDLSRENEIPLSTCYRRVHDMYRDGLMIAERIVITPDGKKYELYRSSFTALTLRLEDAGLSIDATLNDDVADKLFDMWMAMKWNANYPTQS